MAMERHVYFLCTRLFRGLLQAFVVAALLFPHFASAQSAYRLGPQDKLRLKVWEWRPNSGSSVEWEAISGEFVVDPGGALSLPLLGSLKAEGSTVEELALAIGSRLKDVTGLVAAPKASVEVIQYRPFYIVGAVERPGEYPFRPGMTVLQALTIAGGFFRPEASLSRFERESIIAQGDIRVNEAQRVGLTLRRDRLLSESANDDDIKLSREIVERNREVAVTQGIQEERQIFQTRRKSLQSQIDMLNQANRLLQEELKTLAAKIVTQTKQVELSKRELENITSLSGKGLVVSARQLSVEQNVAQMETRMLDLQLAVAKTQQDISRNDRSIVDLRNARSNEILRDLRETQITLDAVTERIATYRTLLFDSQVTAPRQQLPQVDEISRLIFRVARREGGEIRQISADVDTPVMPGDVVRVMRYVGAGTPPSDTAPTR